MLEVPIAKALAKSAIAQPPDSPPCQPDANVPVSKFSAKGSVDSGNELTIAVLVIEATLAPSLMVNVTLKLPPVGYVTTGFFSVDEDGVAPGNSQA